MDVDTVRNLLRQSKRKDDQISQQKKLTPLIEIAYHDDDLELRKLAIVALEEIKNEQAASSIIALLQDENEEIRTTASHSLNPNTDDYTRKQLLQIVSDKKLNATLRVSAIEAFMGCRTQDVISALVQILEQENEATILEAAIQILEDVGTNQEIDLIIKFLNHASDKVRERAAHALGRIEDKDKKAVEPLIASLGDPCADVRRYAAESLGILKEERAVGALVEALGDIDTDVRVNSAVALAEMGATEAIDRLKVLYENADYEAEMIDRVLTRLEAKNTPPS